MFAGLPRIGAAAHAIGDGAGDAFVIQRRIFGNVRAVKIFVTVFDAFVGTLAEADL